jgi:predicted ATPase
LKQTSDSAPGQRGDAANGVAAALAGLFVRNGDMWTLGLSGNNVTLAGVKGLIYVQRLLEHPGQEFHALDLAREPDAAETQAQEGADPAALLAAATVSIGDIGDSGEMLDRRATEDYRRRLADLQEELEDVRGRDDYERGVQIEDEIDFIKREISRAVGLGGRSRRAGAAAERARLNVTRAIRGAIQKIRERHAPLAELLESRIRTGLFCQYVEEPPAVVWDFSNQVGAESAEAAPAPLIRRGDPVAPLAAENRTAFVGREPERESIRRIMARVKLGESRAVAVCGTPGVGKTRIAQEICADAAREGFLPLLGNCYDRKDSVPFIPFVEIMESALRQAASPRAFRDALGHNAPEVARLMPELRRIFPDIEPPLEISPEQSRRILFDAIAELLARAAASTPMLLLLDDLHWADEGTLSLLSHIARSIAKLPVLLMLTYRDDELDSGGPLARSLDDLIRLHMLERVELRGLTPTAVAEMIQALSGRQPPASVADLVHSYTNGNPFFIEELIKHLIERGKLLDSDGEIRRDFKSADVDLPQSLRLVIGRRLARLSEATQRVLAAASVIGPSFSFELLEATSGIDADALLDCLDEAQGLSLIASSLERLEACFQFPHELVRQAVLSGISPARRQRLHLAVAAALERIHPEALDGHAADIAHHLCEAGNAATDFAKTLRFLAGAAKRGLEQSGYEFALGHIGKALELLKNLPESRERMRQELDLQIDNGIAILATKGWYVAEMGSAYQRARELCQALGEDSRLFSVTYGLWSFHLVRGEHQIARGHADEMLRLVPQIADDGMQLLADWASGCSHFFMGEFAAARTSLELSIERYDRKRHRNLALLFGQDPCVSALCYDAMTTWMLGFPDQAEKKAEAALNLARELKHPFSLTWCLSNLTMYHLLRRDVEGVTAAIEEGLAITREYGFAFYEEQFLGFRGLEPVARGKIERSIVAKNPRRFDDERYNLAGTWARCVVAEALTNTPRPEIAVAVLAEAMQLMERNAERYVEAEIHRVKGEVMLKQSEGPRVSAQESGDLQTAAAESMRQALAIARKYGARILELRAATSLAKLMMRSGNPAEVEATLTPVLESFTEGLDTPDLMAARVLLAESRREAPDVRRALARS